MKESIGESIVLWLNLTNTYGFMPDKFMEEVLKKHHMPPCNLIINYYDNFQLRIASGSTASEWQSLEKGIIRGSIMSAVLFSLVMNMLVKATKVVC